MSVLTLSCVVLLLTLQTTMLYCQGDGGHSHSQYATDHEIDEVREEIAALRSEWEMKQRVQEAEKNYWYYSTHSLFKQLYASVSKCTNNISYSKVCGKVIAYQDKTPDGQCPYIGLHTNHTLEEVYIDGVSITHGTPRQHVWSFIASHGENLNDCRGCPCYRQCTGTRVPFIGDNFFCDSGTETWHGIAKIYSDDPLWDGQGCGSSSECCSFNNPPWFCTEFNRSTSDDIELRLCADQPAHNEDVPIEHIELYVQ